MKIISWNVNSVRARINNIINYIADSKHDIFLLQEIKTKNENFPFETFKELGFQSYVFGQKSYNGVAIISKLKMSQIKNDFIKDKLNQSRVITGEVTIKKKKIKIINIYVPNGNPIETDKYLYKKDWLNLFLKVKKELDLSKNIIISGDFNIIPEEIDVYDYKRYENDALFKLEIRKNLGINKSWVYGCLQIF